MTQNNSTSSQYDYTRELNARYVSCVRNVARAVGVDPAGKPKTALVSLAAVALATGSHQHVIDQFNLDRQ